MRSRARLTITLAKELLWQIDRTIDGRTIRNRSHAIELLLREVLETKVTTAVILAGGERRRDTIPAVLPVDEQPLILHTLRHLTDFGIRTIYIIAGEQSSELRRISESGGYLPAAVHFVEESRPLGTAGAIKAIGENLADEPFLVFHSDVLTDINLADFIRFHNNEDALATIAVKPRDAERKYGKVLLQGNRITHFSQANQSVGLSIVNTGVYVLQPEVLSFIEAGRPAHFETDVFPKLAAINELSAFFFQGVWFDISTPESYELAQKRWAKSQ